MRDSLDLALRNYGELRAKEARRDAAGHDLAYSRKAYLPDVVLSAQQLFGTVNALHAPLYSPGGPANASSSLPLAEQHWNAAFGALYSAMAHWNVLTFGRVQTQIELAASTRELRDHELEFERFKHQVRVASAYLKLSTAQRLTHVQTENVSRHEVILQTVAALAGSGLLPGVDESVAKAELAHARSLQLNAREAELAASRELAVLLGVPFREFELEPTFHASAPSDVEASPQVGADHPLLAVHEGQVQRSAKAERVASSEAAPTLYVFAGVQGRGSGFEHSYAQTQSFSPSYLDGVGIERGNYFVGAGLTWNFSSLLRSLSRTAAEEQRTRALSEEQKLAAEELEAQQRFAEQKVSLALENRRHAETQRAAALDRHRQHSALYTNGLGDIVELTQATYALVRAEVQVELAQSEMWQASLLQSAASGDFDAFLNQVGGGSAR